MAGFSVLRVQTTTLDQVNDVKKKLKMNQDETVSFLCEFFTMANSKGALKELDMIPDSIVEILETLEKKAPKIAKMQFLVLSGGLMEYAKRKNIKFPQ